MHHFIVHPVSAEDHYERFDELGDAVWEAVCDDASFGMSCGRIRIPFHREAPSMEEAIASAVAAVRSVGLEVDRVEIDRDDLAILLGEKTVVDFLPAGPDGRPEPVAAAAASRPGTPASGGTTPGLVE